MLVLAVVSTVTVTGTEVSERVIVKLSVLEPPVPSSTVASEMVNPDSSTEPSSQIDERAMPL